LKTLISYEKNNPKQFLPYIKEYKTKIFYELKFNCKRAINFINEYLLKRAKDDEAITFYYKRKGDFYRYIAEYEKGNLKKLTKDSALKAYNQAIEISSKLNVLNLIQLKLFLNYSIFLYNILDEHKKAIEIAKEQLDEMNKKFPVIDEDDNENKELKEIYKLFKKKINIWEKNENNLTINSI